MHAEIKSDIFSPFFVAFRTQSLPFSLRRSQAGRHGGSRQRTTPSWLCTSFSFYYPVDTENIPTLTSLGSNLGGMLLLCWLSSVQLGWWGCRMNPGSGRPIYCCTFTVKGRKKGRAQAAEGFIAPPSIARCWDSVQMTYSNKWVGFTMVYIHGFIRAVQCFHMYLWYKKKKSSGVGSILTPKYTY